MTFKHFKSPTRSAIAATLAAALALTPMTSSPAQAGTEDTVGAIAAASFLALLTAGIIANSANQNGGRATVTTNRRHETGGQGRARVDRRKILPEQCTFTVRRGKDRGTYYRSRCLRREFAGWPYLPDRCEQLVDGRGERQKRGYDAQCLARYGYSEGKPPRAARR